MYAINRVSPKGLSFKLIQVANQPDSTQITCGDKFIIVKHNIHALSQAWYNWQMRGEKIQLAFMFLTNAEREFLLTSITPSEWNAIFSGEEN